VAHKVAPSLSDAWPHLAGRLVLGGHVLPVRIYFEDTDFSGVVYHASYLRFMERGRSDFIRLLGISHEELDAGMHGERMAFALRRIAIDFLKPARIDEVVEVHTRPLPGRGVRMELKQSVRRGHETLVEAEVTVVVVNAAGRPRRLPAEIRGRLEAAGISADSGSAGR
jgi:acyl-CoA thioester hydrolase